MTAFVFRRLTVEEVFDEDDELCFEIEEEHSMTDVWLPRSEVVRLRDHLNTVLGVARL